MYVHNSGLRPIVLGLVATLVLFSGCQDIGFPAPSPSSAPAAAAPGRATLILSDDRAILRVQEYLLGKATSAKAKSYLTELYASGAQWTAKGDLLKDGTRIFNVTLTVDNPNPTIKSYWRKASWTVFDDGKVLPSPQFDASALRIEADLQGLSGG